EERRLGTLMEFADSVEGLVIDPDMMRGDVMVIGPGPGFPEQLFVCTPESDFGVPRPKIRTVCSCDPNFLAHPEPRFDQTVRTLTFDEPFDASLGGISFYPEELQAIATQLPRDSFDVVMWWRSGDLRHHFSVVLPLVSRILKGGGLFMGSGSFDGEEEVVAAASGSFEVPDIAYLPNPDASGFRYEPHHVGFVLAKRGGFFRPLR
ncbi:MAG: hypothetical protein HYS86_03335, partial [Candidatus Chisholmbacteria bacterium]|nr:hypothetical protein [Candidatus Chisholmbacteria bacterium]